MECAKQPWLDRGPEKNMPKAPIKIIHFQLRPYMGYSSIDRVFAPIRKHFPPEIVCHVATSRFESRGVFRRFFNIVEAALRQSEVNHVTGDLHYLTFLFRKKRTLLTIHDLVSVHRLRGWRRSVFLFMWYWLPVRRSAVVSVISEFTKQELLRHIKVDPRKVRVVYDCVSDDFKPTARKFDAAKPVILQVGTRPNKNLERVAEALRAVQCHLRIVGRLDDEQTGTLARCGIDYSCVSNISNEEVIDEYRRCDMLVFASTYEGFGLPILEAQATGRPVVTSNILSMPEVAGNAACMVDPFDVSSIRRGILQIIDDRTYRDGLVRRGFENIDRFRPEKIAQDYADIYRELTE